MPVKVDALQERAEAVPHPHDGNSDFIHCRKRRRLAAAPGWEQGAKGCPS
jgi:hypothetical protein